MLDSGITDSKGCRTPAEFALTTKPILTEILFGDMFKWFIRSSLKRLIRSLMVSSFLLLTLSGRRYRPATRYEDTMSHLIKQ